jgi:adenosylmethionine-8-amino-7-oxononanoate aminotransferase
VIAFVAETVVGATAGAVPPVADYFRRIRATHALAAASNSKTARGRVQTR